MNNIISKSNKSLESSSFGLDLSVKNNGYKLATRDVEITVWPEFINSQAGVAGNLFVWTYQVRIENKRSGLIKLINRHWKIVDENGEIQEVDGEGVVGKQPEILSNGFFEYSSGVHLAYPSGIMSGYYEMQDEKGESFRALIPSFSLDVPSVKKVIN